MAAAKPTKPGDIIFTKNIVTARQAALWPYFVVIAGFLLCFIRFPGEWNADTHSQHAQMLSGLYADWHPPVFAAFWRVVNTAWSTVTGIQVTGSGVLYIVHALMLWGGLALLVRAGRDFFLSFTGTVRWQFCLVLGALLFFGVSEMVPMPRFIFKDTAMMAAYILALGILCNFPETRVPKIIAALFCLLLFFYGTAVRHNAIFAVLPLLFILVAKYNPRSTWKLLTLSTLFLWGILLLSIHGINYGVLKAEKQHSMQEIFYADIWRLNFRTKTFDLPPPVKGVGWEPLTEESFFRFYDRVPYVKAAFRFINAYHRDAPIAIFRDFSGAQDDYKLLFRAWLDKILKHPAAYIETRQRMFLRMLSQYSFMGFNGRWYLVFAVAVLGVLTARLVRKQMLGDITPYCVTLSGLLYVLPYLVFLTDIQRRYLFWFFFASLFGAIWFAGVTYMKRRIQSNSLSESHS